jgi:hypothetical protein
LNSSTLAKVFALAAMLSMAGGICQSALAQGPLPDAPQPAVETSSFVSTPSPVPSQHRFWDQENLALFAGTAALSTGDFLVTRSNLQSGGTELNPMVRIFGRSSAGLAVNFAGETAGVIGISYFLHKTGHHRLERLSTTVNLGGSVGAIAYGLTHR